MTIKNSTANYWKNNPWQLPAFRPCLVVWLFDCLVVWFPSLPDPSGRFFLFILVCQVYIRVRSNFKLFLCFRIRFSGILPDFFFFPFWFLFSVFIWFSSYGFLSVFVLVVWPEKTLSDVSFSAWFFCQKIFFKFFYFFVKNYLTRYPVCAILSVSARYPV